MPIQCLKKDNIIFGIGNACFFDAELLLKYYDIHYPIDDSSPKPYTVSLYCNLNFLGTACPAQPDKSCCIGLLSSSSLCSIL